jgi:hypothetical protein
LEEKLLPTWWRVDGTPPLSGFESVVSIEMSIDISYDNPNKKSDDAEVWPDDDGERIPRTVEDRRELGYKTKQGCRCWMSHTVKWRGTEDESPDF